MDLLNVLKTKRLYLDGGMGTLLFKKGLPAGELPELWNISHGDIVTEIHRAYFDAGSNIVCTNTFGANALKFEKTRLEEAIKSAVENAKKARETSNSNQEKFIALDMGPLGKLLKPFGDLDFEDAVSVFAQTVKLGVKYGVDLIFIETMNDSYETKAALLAAKENCDLPVFVSNSFDADGKLLTGATADVTVAIAESMGADAVGINCSLGPQQMLPVIKTLLENASVPVFVKPNAGLPVEENGETVFKVDADEFSHEMKKIAQMGVNILGGCCGTTPEYIKKTVEKTQSVEYVSPAFKNKTVVTSYTHAVIIGNDPKIIGERINPTGKKRFKQALNENDINYILNEGIGQQKQGADILDVNVGLPGINEPALLQNAVFQLQGVLDLPLQIDTANIEALEKSLRIYNGKAMINSVNGKEESMNAVFPLVKKYGGVVVALTLDEKGIPDSVEGRIAIAEKIIDRAGDYGIDKKDIVFDTLCMSVATDSYAAVKTLDSLEYIRKTLGINTVLGVSNISFGLPEREAVNAEFLSLALQKGLSCAIVNPFSAAIMKTYYSYRMLTSADKDCNNFINYVGTLTEKVTQRANVETNGTISDSSTLKSVVEKGLKKQAEELTDNLLKTKSPMEIIDSEIIPALDNVGKGFEKNTVFLPQLLMSAESAKCAFEKIKEAVKKSGKTSEKKGKFVIATVKGDVHDIGKNIVKVLLENYGFDVIDLGKDVAPEKIVEAVKNTHAPLCGLSALMTTTVPAMEETVNLLRKQAPFCKIVVGGAVLTEEYAKKIGADCFGKNAMATVRFAEKNC